ncbi:hypothetical protein QFC21_004220 [Naganishia friedmannii]|uniref:Uncharacterized protein n=1 Tax=Naganishia friedmannii TaxID=89922 RepID=A0ACC2VIV4_9TREE|nr:hypothetical protein QFC21_004220 [Naganishia friedmannii]
MPSNTAALQERDPEGFLRALFATTEASEIEDHVSESEEDDIVSCNPRMTDAPLPIGTQRSVRISQPIERVTSPVAVRKSQKRKGGTRKPDHLKHIPIRAEKAQKRMDERDALQQAVLKQREELSVAKEKQKKTKSQTKAVKEKANSIKDQAQSAQKQPEETQNDNSVPKAPRPRPVPTQRLPDPTFAVQERAAPPPASSSSSLAAASSNTSNTAPRRASGLAA